MENCFDNYQEEELLNVANQIYCNNCKRMANATTGNKIYTSPEVLTIILNRGKGLEFDVNFEYPLYINIDKYIKDKSSKNNNYELICILTHLGPSGMSGHFIAFCKSPNNEKWYCYNDANVSESGDPRNVNIGEIEGIPYVLFYQKCKPDKVINNEKSYSNDCNKDPNSITLYFNYGEKQFYLDVDRYISIRKIINLLKNYINNKDISLFRQTKDNLDLLEENKTINYYGLENEDKILVLDNN